MRSVLALICSLTATITHTACFGAEDRIPAFPTAEGFGAYAKGGRGGRIIYVTNLKDFSPEEAVIPGSLRAACIAKGPRIIVFRISGTVELKAPLAIFEPYCTIAGQTAPGDGLCIRGDAVKIGARAKPTHDIVVRHMRFRCGPGRRKGHSPDTLAINNCRDVIIDHCSVTWGVDECLSITAHPTGFKNNGCVKVKEFTGEPAVTKNVTVQWCVVAEGLNRSTHNKGAHSKGLMVAYGPSSISLHHNLIAHNVDRNPYLPAECESPFILDVRNNLVYNWKVNTAVAYRKINHKDRMNFVGNRYLPGPNSRKKPCLTLSVKTRVFLNDNLGPVRTKATDPENKAMKGIGRVVAEAFDLPPVTTHPANELASALLPKVGATLPRRDSADARLVQEVTDRKGTIIDHPKQVGGWPELKSGEPPADTDLDGMPDAWEKTHGFDPNDETDGNKDADEDGYHNVEEYLNATNPRKTETIGQQPAQRDAAERAR